MTQPSVRVVVPCFNYGRFVRDAVSSALAQRDADVEVVVVDDGSDDGETPEACDACRALGATVLHVERGGAAAARNRGAAGARADFLAFLDADDRLLPNFTRDLAAAIEAEGRAGRGADVSHAYGQYRATGLHELVWRVPDWDPVLELITNLHSLAALVRRSAFEAVGGFDASLRQDYEDWDLWIRCIEHGYRGVRVERPVYEWRRHSLASGLYRALGRHEALVERLLARHERLYRERALEVIGRALRMLHAANATWLDEDGSPIGLGDERRRLARAEAAVPMLTAERDAARAEIARVRAEYEAKPSVRFGRALFALADALPRPMAAVARRSLQGAGRLVRRLPSSGR